MISIENASACLPVKPLEQVELNSVKSWESDHTPTPSEDDLRFNQKFTNYRKKSQHSNSTCLADNFSSAASSDGLHGYKGSDDEREEEITDDDARTFVDFNPNKSSSNESIEYEEAKSEKSIKIINNQERISLEPVMRAFKDTRLFSINRSLSVTSIGQDSIDHHSQICKLPDINLDGHEAVEKMEGLSAWRQLDSLLPAAATSDLIEDIETGLHAQFTSLQQHDEKEYELINVMPKTKLFTRINASFYSSESSSCTDSQECLDSVVDDMAEGLLEELYDEFFIIKNPYFDDQKADLNLAIFRSSDQAQYLEASTPALPRNKSNPKILQYMNVFHCDSDTEEEIFDKAECNIDKEIENDEEEDANIDLEEKLFQSMQEASSYNQQESKQYPRVDSKQQVKEESTTTAQLKTYPSPVVVRTADDEVIFCQKHQEYVGIREQIMNDKICCCCIKKSQIEQEKCDAMKNKMLEQQNILNLERKDASEVHGIYKNATEKWQCCTEDELTNFIDLTVHIMNMNDFIDLDVSFAKGQMYHVDYEQYISTELCMAVNDNFSKVKCFMGKNSDMRMQIMSGFFMIDGVIFDPSRENMKFHEMKLKPNSKIVLVRQMTSSEQFVAPEIRYSQ